MIKDWCITIAMLIGFSLLVVFLCSNYVNSSEGLLSIYGYEKFKSYMFPKRNKHIYIQ